MRITNNLYVLSGGNYSGGEYGTLGNVYGIKTDNGIILIDCGLPETGLIMIEDTLKYYGLENEKITHVVLTHAHVDHCGCCKELQSRGAKIVVGEGDVHHCVEGGFSLFRDTRYEEGHYHYFPAFEPDIVVKEDSTLNINGIDFEFILIPGHTNGSMVIRINFEGKVIMFTGDSICPMGEQCEKVGLGWNGDPDFSREKFVNSMLKLQQYDTDMVLAGHGNLCVRNGVNVLRNAGKQAYMTMR